MMTHNKHLMLIQSLKIHLFELASKKHKNKKEKEIFEKKKPNLIVSHWDFD